MELLAPAFLRKLEALALHAHALGTGSARGQRSSRHAGSGIAFAGHRAYAPGDDFRFIDFALYARSDRLYVKQLEEERELHVELLLDCSASMGDKLARGKELAAALGYIALAQLDRVAVQPFASEPLPPLAPLRGPKRVLLLLRYLAALSATGGTDLPLAARAVAARSRGGLAIVLSDGFDLDGLQRGVELLRHARAQPVVLLLHDARDAEVPVGAVTLVDRETLAERTLVLDARSIATYREQLVRARERTLHALRERAVPAFAVDVAQPVEQVVLGLLRAGGVVR